MEHNTGLSLDELQALCAEWQKRLRLVDWRIYLSIERARDFDNEGKAAEIKMFRSSKEATIKLLDELDYPPTCVVSQDHEEDLVHELLHLHFDAAKAKPGTGSEVAINCITEALVKLRREAQEAKHAAVFSPE